MERRRRGVDRIDNARMTGGPAGPGPTEGSPQPAHGLADLPEILYVPDLAALLRVTDKAIRHRVARGLLPPPMKLGRALAWTREVVLGWLRERGRSAGPVDMKITLRPYAKDNTRWQIDIRLMNPCNSDHEIRRRMVAPAGHDPKQARAWGERQVAALLRELVGESAAVKEPEVALPALTRAPTISAPRKEVAPPRARPVTLADFYATRFEPKCQRPLPHEAPPPETPWISQLRGFWEGGALALGCPACTSRPKPGPKIGSRMRAPAPTGTSRGTPPAPHGSSPVPPAAARSRSRLPTTASPTHWKPGRAGSRRFRSGSSGLKVASFAREIAPW